MSLEVFGILFAGFLTLCIYSFLYKDNPFYRFAEYLFVGVSAGYTLARAFNDVFDKKIWGPLADPAPGNSVEWTLFIPVILGIFLILKLVPQVSWLSRWALAFVVGGTIGLSMTSRFKSDVIEQIKATISPFQAAELPSKELHRQLVMSSENLKTHAQGSTEAEFLALNQFYTKYHHYLRVELKRTSGFEVTSPSFPAKSVNSAIEMERTALQAQASAMGKLLSELQRLSNQTPLLSDRLRSELQKLERKTALYVKDGSRGSSDKEIVDQVFFLESDFKRKTSDLKKFRKLQTSFSDGVESLRVKLSEGSAQFKSAPQVLMKDPRLWVTQESSRWQKLTEVLQVLRSVSVQCAELAGIVSRNAGDADLSLGSWQGMASLQSSIKSRLKMTSSLLSADLSSADPVDWKGLLYGFIIAVMALSILIYFFFSTEHVGAVGVSATLGIYFLMICFGSSFGFTIMARISLLIGRVSFLTGKFWQTLLSVFGGG
jgi:hypothetical protein